MLTQSMGDDIIRMYLKNNTRICCMKYYIVTAACGHVGRGRYVPIDFPVVAETP